jgi:hypothetical protein
MWIRTLVTGKRTVIPVQCTRTVYNQLRMHRKFQTGEWPKEKIRKLQHTYKKMYLDKEEGQRVGSLSE